nr:uncharacterized protein LOC109752496 [Aegilops tauschii subsp. strangulata]
MASRKVKPSASPAWYEPALDAPNVSEKRLAATRLLAARESNERGKTELRVASNVPKPEGSMFFPFFTSSITAGRVRAPCGGLEIRRQDSLSSEALPDDELSAVLRLLVGDNQEYPPSAFVPLFHRTDWEQVVASRPTFDSRGLVLPAPTGVPAVPKPVELSSDESRGEEEDSEVTPEGMGETSPLSKADILRALPDDAETDARQEKGELPVIPTRGRSSLVSRDVTPAMAPSGAASGPSAASGSALGASVPAPQASRLSGFKLTKPLSSAKKRKGDVATMPPSAEKGGDSTRTSPARSPSRDQEEHLHESVPEVPLAPEVPMSGSATEVPKSQEPLVSQALVMMPSPLPAAPLLPGSSASSAVLERALLEITQPREDLLGADPRLAVAASEKEKQAAAKATADREAARKDVVAAHDR